MYYVYVDEYIGSGRKCLGVGFTGDLLALAGITMGPGTLNTLVYYEEAGTWEIAKARVEELAKLIEDPLRKFVKDWQARHGVLTGGMALADVQKNWDAFGPIKA
jgi:hypothetical protein